MINGEKLNVGGQGSRWSTLSHLCSFKNIGAIIIDEEHEASYKQDSNPRYHARDVAVLRAQYNQAVLLLGSATPSLESRARATKGVYELIRLTQRPIRQPKFQKLKSLIFVIILAKMKLVTSLRF